MRAIEILLEDYNTSLESDLNNLIVAAKSSGATKLNTQDLVKQLYGMGYSVNANNILSLLNSNPAVSNATPEIVQLTPANAQPAAAGAGQDSAARVSDMAAKASSLG